MQSNNCVTRHVCRVASGLVLLEAVLIAGGVKAQPPRRVVDAHAHVSPASAAALLDAFRRNNVVAAVVMGRQQGDIPALTASATATGVRLLHGLTTETEMLGLSEALLEERFGTPPLDVIAELAPQYAGVSPDDSSADAVFGWAEARDRPVGLHMGLTAPGIALGRRSGYRVRLGSPLLLEDVLVRHPKLRLWVMHAGNPFVDEMIGLLWAFPSVYVDLSATGCATGSTAWQCPLGELVEHGFEDRLMFGSDVAADTSIIGRSIQYIEQAGFLTPAQKDKVLCRNAAQFFRLDGVCDGPRER